MSTGKKKAGGRIELQILERSRQENKEGLSEGKFFVSTRSFHENSQLALVTQTLLVAVSLHALTSLVLIDLSFPPFF